MTRRCRSIAVLVSGSILSLVLLVLRPTQFAANEPANPDITEVQITNAATGVTAPDWSPDFKPVCVLRGDVIAYVGEDNAASLIYTQRKNANPNDDSDPTAPPFNDPIKQVKTESGVTYATLQFSPDGVWILVEKTDPGGERRLEIIRWKNQENDCDDPCTSECNSMRARTGCC